MAKCYAWVGESKFLSTPSVRRATRPSLRIRHTACISIHALREEGDIIKFFNSTQRSRFLSTPSVRRATQDRGAGIDDILISIHALREEGDNLPL